MRKFIISASILIASTCLTGSSFANGFSASLDCATGFQGGVLCVAFPGGQPHYAWTTTGSLQISHACSTSSDYCHAECVGNGNGTISVTVTNSSGISDLETEAFYCIDGKADQ